MCRNLTCFIFLAVPPKHTLGCGSVKGDKKFDTDYKFWQISYKKFNMLNRYNKHTLRVLCTNNLTEKYSLSKVLSPLTDPHPGVCFRGTAGRLKQVNFCTKHRIPFCLRKPNRLTCPIGGQKTCYTACNRIPFWR